MEIISAPLDFLGVNYYTRSLVQAAEQGPLRVNSIQPEGDYTQMGWEVYPQGLTDLLLRVERDYAPGTIYITENGCAYEDELTSEGQVNDKDRTLYLYKHFVAAHDAISQGVPLRGYFVWSLLDNFEWAYGYSRRFGIVYVDFETLERYPKDSARYYQAVARANALQIR
jgi:beta-glucosidase